MTLRAVAIALGADVRDRPERARGARDRAPDWVADGTPEPLRGRAAAGARARRGSATRALDLVRYASDASPYRSIPGRWRSRATSPTCRRCSRSRARTGTPLVFRAGGTSLNGQSQTRRASWWTSAATSSASASRTEGARVRAQPGVDPRPRQPHARPPRQAHRPRPGEHRHRLRRRRGGQQLGRDALRRPRRLLQHAVSSLTFVLANGAVIDTAADGRRARRFAAAAPELAAGLRGDPRRAARRRGAVRADRAQVRDQEHDRLSPVRVPRRRRSRWRSSGGC